MVEAVQKTTPDANQSRYEPDGKRLHAKIYAPFKVYYDGLAESVSAANGTGPFDILAGHHNFITLLTPCDIVVRSDGKEDKFAITRAIMHVKKDEVVIFLDV